MPNLSDVFNLSGDKFIDELFDFVIENGFNSQKSTPIEKTVVYIVTAQGIIENGGFKYFFESDFDDGKVSHEEIINYFKKIGSVNTASTLKKILEIFPNSKPQKNLYKRQEYIEKYIDSDKNRIVDRLESDLFNYMRMESANLEKYLKNNKDFFTEIK
ncbi:hypothetical protein NBRC116493_35850 [Aurantivibrio infirmus]